MKSKLKAKRKLKRSSADEAGFTIVEMVVAIPVTFLILGLVFASIGVTVGLMGQVTSGAGAARLASQVQDELSAARNCAQVSSIISKRTTVAADDKFLVSFGTYVCVEGKSFPLEISVKQPNDDRTYFSKKLTLMAV